MGRMAAPPPPPPSSLRSMPHCRRQSFKMRIWSDWSTMAKDPSRGTGGTEEEEDVGPPPPPPPPPAAAARTLGSSASSAPFQRRILAHTEWKVPRVTRSIWGGGPSRRRPSPATSSCTIAPPSSSSGPSPPWPSRGSPPPLGPPSNSICSPSNPSSLPLISPAAFLVKVTARTPPPPIPPSLWLSPPSSSSSSSSSLQAPWRR